MTAMAGAEGMQCSERIETLGVHGPFGKARYKIEKLNVELRNAVIMMEMVAAKVSGAVIDSLMAGLRKGTIDPDDIADWNEYFFAQRYLLVKRIRKQIQDLQSFVYRRRGEGPLEGVVKQPETGVPPDPLQRQGRQFVRCYLFERVHHRPLLAPKRLLRDPEMEAVGRRFAAHDGLRIQHDAALPTRPYGHARRKSHCILSSHTDSQIFRHYANMLSARYEKIITEEGFAASVLAYRRLDAPKCNIHFANDAFDWIEKNSPCLALTFDVKDFFETFDHRQLKQQRKAVLGVEELPPDHYNVFKAITRYARDARAVFTKNAIRAQLKRHWRELHSLLAQVRQLGVGIAFLIAPRAILVKSY